MTTQNGRAFNEWLRAQLKAKKMSQRQLAQQSGVDHSTISRLIRGDRMPSLGTATKLARGLRELRDDADTPQYLGLVAAGNTNPTARVEYALRADELLSEPQVRQIMEYYLAVRMRRYGRSLPAAEEATAAPERPTDHRLARPAAPVRSMGAAASVTPVGVGFGSDPPGLPVGRPGTGALLAHIRARPGFALHDPGLGDSERRRLGRRRSHFPGSGSAARPDDPAARRARGAASSSRRSASSDQGRMPLDPTIRRRAVAEAPPPRRADRRHRTRAACRSTRRSGGAPLPRRRLLVARPALTAHRE